MKKYIKYCVLFFAMHTSYAYTVEELFKKWDQLIQKDAESNGLRRGKYEDKGITDYREDDYIPTELEDFYKAIKSFRGYDERDEGISSEAGRKIVKPLMALCALESLSPTQLTKESKKLCQAAPLVFRDTCSDLMSSIHRFGSDSSNVVAYYLNRNHPEHVLERFDKKIMEESKKQFVNNEPDGWMNTIKNKIKIW